MDETAKELREIRIEMNSMSLNLINFMKTHETQIEELKIRQKDHHENIYGTAGAAGLRIEQDRQKTELERMKSEEKSKKNTLTTIGIGVVTLFLTTVWKLITGK